MRDIFFDIMGYTKGDEKKTKSTLIYIIIKLILSKWNIRSLWNIK